MKLFRCSVCAEKDARIADLKAHIAQLQAQIFPQQQGEPRIRELEMDGVLSGQQHIIEIPESAETQAELSERDRLFAGTY